MRLSRFALVIAFVASLIAGLVGIVTQPFVEPIVSVPPTVDPKRLEEHVRYLSKDLYPRSYDQFKNIELAAAYIHKAFEASGGRVAVQEVAVQEAKYRNIIVRFGPSAGPVLVVGAHYDSHGDGNAGARFPLGHSEETHTPGADDNASGVAGLIELAQLLGQSKQQHAIELVAYTLEEPPHFRTEHMGSAWHARLLKRENREVELMISLEMIGYFSDQPNSQHYPVPGLASLYSERGNFIALVGNLTHFSAIRKVKAAMTGATSLPVYSINASPIMQGIDFSDHLSYWNQGIPAIMITDTAFLRNQNYHLAGDTFEKLDYGKMAKVVQGVYAFTQSP
jgi:Zn-dependent M28 family amino/carboxypeptidase